MSLSDVFSLIKLPRLNKSSSSVHITENSTSSELKVAISGSFIANYKLKPSPKLVWSYSIPPNYKINCVDQRGELYFVGVENKKKNLLLVVERLEHDSKLIKEIEFESNVVNLKSIEEGLIVVLKDSTIFYDLEFNKKWSIDSLYGNFYSKFIEDDILLNIELKSKKINYRLFNFKGTEINSKIIEYSNLKNPIFDYNEGILYQLYDKNQLDLIKLPNFIQLKTIALDIKGDQQPLIKSPSKDRLILATGSDLYLINTQFNIFLSHLTFKSELSYLNVINKSFGLILVKSELNGFTINLDSNNLRDSLGKAVKKELKVKQVESILNINGQTKESDAIIIKDLVKNDINKSLKEYLNAKNEFYTEDDKLITYEFVKQLTEEILKLEELPEEALTYLLTHPLFPIVELDKLRSNQRLLRQAIVTGNVSIGDLINELNTTESDEIFKDLITRILEFPTNKLNFKNVNSIKIITKIINLNFGYELVSILIDSNGFFINEEIIDILLDLISRKVEALNAGSKTLSVIEQAELRNLKTVQKIPVYSIETL